MNTYRFKLVSREEARVLARMNSKLKIEFV